MVGPTENGAIPLISSAAGVGAKRGAFYGPTGRAHMKGPVGDASVADAALDEADQRRLWDLSEQVVAHKFL